MRKEFCKYIFPAMGSFLLSGIYSIVDGIFVGNAVGDDGLAAINLAWPLVALIISLGTGIGIGGSVIISLNKGADKHETAEKAEGTTIFFLIFSSLILIAILFFAGGPLLTLLGAKGVLHEYALIYINYLLIGAVFQVCACGLLPLIRNKGATIFAMVSMACGCITNIILDWIFVITLDMGMKGAALATVAGQIFTIILCILFYLKPENRIKLSYLIPDFKIIKSIIRVGISPFGLTYLPSVTIIFMNLQTLKYGGNAAVSAYAVLAYILSFMELMIQGISDGSQPLLSLCQGAGKKKELAIYKRWMYILAIGTGGISGIITFLLRNHIPFLFGASESSSQIIVDATPAFALVLFLYGISKAMISYFYATDKTTASAVMVYGEVLITVGLIYLLPLWFSLDGVWYTMPVVQLILICIGLIFTRIVERQHTKEPKTC